MCTFEPFSFNHPTVHSLSFKKPSVATTHMPDNVSEMKSSKIYAHPSFVVYITFSLFIDILCVAPFSSQYFLLSTFSEVYPRHQTLKPSLTDSTLWETDGFLF